MADNITLDPGSGGQTIRALDDGTQVWPAGVTAFATTVGTPDVLAVVTPTAGLPVRLADGSGYLATLPVSAASLPLPSGAATAAKQPALGTAGAASTDVITVQGIASGTALIVNGSGVTQPVSDAGGSITVDNGGTFAVQAAQSGTWTVQPGNTANTTAWLVTGTGGTFPVTDSGGTLTVDAPVGTPVFVRLSDGSAAISTLPVSLASVPSHAVTNAGTFATQVDGAALTALQLIDNLVLAEDAAHASGDPGVQALAVRNDSDASLAGTTGDYTPLQVDSNGYLKVNIKAGAGSGGTASTDDAAFTAASGSGTPMMGFVTADSVDSGDVGVVGMLANRQLKVTLYDSGGSELAVGGGTQYTEDAAAAANPIGNALIVVRDDARGGSLVSADGDNVGLRGTNAGELYVKHTDAITVNSHAVTNAGTFAVQAAQSGTWNITNVSGTVSLPTGASTLAEQQSQTTALQLIDNLVLAEDAAHASADPGIQTLAVRKATPVNLSGADGDYEPLQISVGRLWTSATVDAALPAGTNNVGDVDIETFESSADVTMQNAATATGNGTVLTTTGYGTAIVQITGTFVGTITFEATGDGTNFHAISATLIGAATIATTGTTTGIYRVSVAGITSIRARISAYTSGSITAIGRATNSPMATKVVQISGAVTSVTTVGTLSGGGIAHDGADSGNPVKVGARAALTLSDDTMVANGDRTDLVSDADGALITRPIPLGDIVSERVSNTDGTSTAFTNFGATASTRNVVTGYSVYNASATAGYIDFRDGTAGSILWTVPIPATGGANFAIPAGIFRTTANTALAYDVSAALTTVYISVTGYKSKVA